LVSRLNGGTHYIPQVRDVVDASNGLAGRKNWPPGTPRSGQPIYNLVASYAMGRYDAGGGDLQDGYGPMQPTLQNNNIQVPRQGFSHSGGRAANQGVSPGNRPAFGQGLECYTCHAAWQNNCIGCHLDAFYDANANNFFFSQVTSECIYFNFNANFVYQNPVNFMMGINDRGCIIPY
jgi:hypothetical protein